ncbi:MAG TPA: glycosyl hydrolase family 28-related protein [Methylomirabilota bacterium]|nr:glycosyl hydrolase family 28-related protein [Methylomirabilota bacterium]
MTVATGVTARILTPVTNTVGGSFSIGSGATLSLAGGASLPNNTVFSGGGTIDFNAGTFTGTSFVFWLQTLATQEAATLNTARLLIGYGGNSTYTINNPAAQLVCTGAGGSSILGRSGTAGTLVLEQGAVDLTANGSQLFLAFDSSSGSKGTLTVQGGTFDLGPNTLYINYAGTGANNAGTVNLLGGTLTAEAIQFGNGGTYSAGSTASLNVSGGTLYIGVGGISKNSLGTLAVSTILSGGIIAATLPWSSSNAMTLTLTNGGVTFQTADATGTAQNISLSGVLSGTGGLAKTGAGTLTLNGANTYSGGTTNNAGILAVTTASSGAGAYSLAGGAALNVQVAGTGTSLQMSSFTPNAGSTLNLYLNSSGNPTAPIINVSGALMPASTVTINLGGIISGAGQFPLIKYGSLGGAGFGAFVLGSFTLPIGPVGSAVLVNDTTNQSIDLNVTIPPPARLTWDGTINGNWNIGGTANWKTNTYYTETNGIGPAVVFNDTASGPNTNIILTSTVTPDSVTVSNSALTYSISGSGGITGVSGLIKAGGGTFILGGKNTYTGGTEIDAGTLVVTMTNNVSMPYAVNGGSLQTSVTTPGTSLAMSSLACGSNNPQLTFDFGNLNGTIAPAINNSGNLTMNGNVKINVTNLNLSSTGSAVLLRYAGSRSGTGSFVAGTVPAGLTILDDAAHQQVVAYTPGFRVVIPSLNTNEIVVAAATPQQYGAVGDGVTDDSVAFQNAINAVYNSGGQGGGVLFVPSGRYAFYNNITIPVGVTLHGDWTDWTKGTNGLVGTTFKIYFGAGQTNTTPFISMGNSTALRDVNIWYPNQNPASITGYPFSIGVVGDSVVNNVVLVNSYQGIESGINPADHSSEWILSTVIGTPLFMGIMQQGIGADISHAADIRFSPDVWANSGLTNAPSAGGSYAAWMRTYGTGIQLVRLDGFITIGIQISGYNVGMDFESDSFGASGSCFYNGWVTNCATAVLAQEMQVDSGLEFSDFTLEGDTAVSRTDMTGEAAVGFDDCQIIGAGGTAVYCTGTNWQSEMSFQNCAITGTMNLAGPGVFNLVDCSLNASTQCVMSASATRAAFTGCTFSPSQKIVNSGNVSNLLVDARQSISNAMPIVSWTNVMNSYASCRPAKTNLYVATGYGATGNGTNDDTAAIQSALNAAGTNGGGVVYLPPGAYHLTNTLDVPKGVELLGSYEARHNSGLAGDGIVKGAILQPYGGQGTTNGPPAVVLETNAGLVGMTINYLSQNSNCIPFPPTIQGRGPNVYIIGVVCLDPYYYLDLDTYTCTNHFIDMMDCNEIEAGVRVGNGSSGSIVDCEFGPYANGFDISNFVAFTFGNCTELLVKDFAIDENIFMHFISEGGGGPNVTAISAMCDVTYDGFIFDAMPSCTFTDVNPEWLVILGHGFPSLTNATELITATNFQGTVRIFNSPLWGGPQQNCVVNGGDVGLELAHMWQNAWSGSQISGGVFHLVNAEIFNDSNPMYVTFGSNAGIVGKTNEFIGSFSYYGCTYTNNNAANPVNVWMDYALSSYTVLSKVQGIQTVVLKSPMNQVPPLTIQSVSASQGITLQWPDSGVQANDAGTSSATSQPNVYYTPSLTPPVVWTQVTNTPVLSNGQWTLNLPLGNNASGFYQLR